MRWVFANQANGEEQTYRTEKLRAIEAWWRSFAGKASAISKSFSQGRQTELVEWMHRHLHAIDERLMWEFGPAVSGGGHRLVITPEVHHDLRPLVRSVLKRAPVLGGWEFHDHRPPEDAESAIALLQARTGLCMHPADADVTLAMNPHRRIDVRFTFARGASRRREATSAAFVLSECLVGERILNGWIGEIKGVPASNGFFGFGSSKRGANAVPLDMFGAAVKSMIGSVMNDLPKHPLHTVEVEQLPWSVYRGPGNMDENAPSQTDLMIGNTAFLEIVQAGVSDPLFSSARFSRCGETMVYIKIHQGGIEPSSRLDHRNRIEGIVGRTLRDAKLGACIGSALGTHHAYLHVALSNMGDALKTIKKVLQEQRVPKRSWVQFLDADLAKEWIGVYDDSPEPPGM